MEILFKNKRLRKLCTKQQLAQRKCGKRRADLIRQRLDDLRAAETLETMRFLTGRCHELAGDREGQLSLDLDHPYRLIFEPANNPVPLKEDGGLDWPEVTAVRILEIVDTHE